jgi:heme/copper-type cytochrome/quinol oxidase subunit 3
MWMFLVSDAFGFAAFLSIYASARNNEAVWVKPGEPALGILFTAVLTVLLMATSLSNVLAWAAAQEGDRKKAVTLLWLTAAGGALFLVGQLQEWWGIVGHGLMREGLVFGRSTRASSFYAITGYHGLHVLVGVVYILAVIRQYRRERMTAHHIEILGLYWCFVDLVWVFVFNFLYLF